MPAPLSAPELLDKQQKDKQAKEVEDRHVKEATKGAELLSDSSAFRSSTDAAPTNQTTNDQVREINNQIGRTNGIGSTGKVDSFTTADGKTITGQTYTSKDGTFLVAPGGADGKGTKYQIEAGANGGDRTISKIDTDGKKEPVALRPSTPTAAASSSDASVAAAPAAPGQVADTTKKDPLKDVTTIATAPPPAIDATPHPATDLTPHPATGAGADLTPHPPAELTPHPAAGSGVDLTHPVVTDTGAGGAGQAGGGGSHINAGGDGGGGAALKDTGRGQSTISTGGDANKGTNSTGTITDASGNINAKPKPVQGGSSGDTSITPPAAKQNGPSGDSTVTPITPVAKPPGTAGDTVITPPAAKQTGPSGESTITSTTGGPKPTGSSGDTVITPPAAKQNGPSGESTITSTTGGPKPTGSSGDTVITPPAAKQNVPSGESTITSTTGGPKPTGSSGDTVITPPAAKQNGPSGESTITSTTGGPKPAGPSGDTVITPPAAKQNGPSGDGAITSPVVKSAGDSSTGPVQKPGPQSPVDSTVGSISNKPVQQLPVDANTGTPIQKNPNLPVEGSIASAPVRAPGDSSVIQAPKPGADSTAGTNLPKPGGDIAAGTIQNLPRPVLPTDVLAPTPAQTLSLKQAGFDINNPTDASFLAAARAQLMAGRLGDGTTANTTLANALSGANMSEVNKLASFLTARPDMQAQSVVLDQANLAKLNALFRPEVASAVAGLPATLDIKNLAGRGIGEFLAVQQGPVTQKDIYNELNKIAGQLMHPTDVTQKLAMVDLMTRTVTKPLETTVPSTLLVPTKVETLVVKPETLVVKPENAAVVNTALADARTRAAEMAELTPQKIVAPVAARTDVAEGIGALAIARALTPANTANQTGEGKLGLDPLLSGVKPNALTTAEGMANTRAAEEAVRGAAARLSEIDIKTGQGGSNMTLTPRSEIAEVADKHVDKKKKPDDKGEIGGISIDSSMLTGAALRIFDTKSEDKKEDASQAKKDEENKAQRRKYIVKPNDSLESIAVKTYRDPRLAALIAAVNSEVIAEDADPRAPLAPGQTLWLPSESEIAAFFENISAAATGEQLSPEEELARRFGNGWDGAASSDTSTGPSTGPNTNPVASLMDAAVMATIKRRENVEKLLGPLPTKKIDQINYTVRLGDSLKSIAMKHPALQDVSLWELVAKVNDISVPARDPSAVKLSRGSTLRLPTPEEISQHRALNDSKKTGPATTAPPQRKGPKSIVLPPGNPFAIDAASNGPPSTVVDEHAITRVSAPIRDAGASLLRAGGFVKDQNRTNDDAATIVTAPLDRLPRPEISKPVTTDKPSIENIKILSPDCRVVRKHQVDASGRLYQAQLEVLYGNEWKSVMMYNISDGNCWRKSINEVGVTEILQLELPVPAIHQMLESDFANNWEEHRDRFINSIDSF